MAQQVDVWAAGVCLFVWVWGCLPFQGDSIPDMFTAIKEKPLTFPAHPECDPNLKDLITKVSTVKHCVQQSAICPDMCARSAIMSINVGEQHGSRRCMVKASVLTSQDRLLMGISVSQVCVA